jgi:hypothetical protein
VHVNRYATFTPKPFCVTDVVGVAMGASLPYAIMLVGIRRGRLSDRHLSLRAQRPVMMIIGLASVSVGL